DHLRRAAAELAPPRARERLHRLQRRVVLEHDRALASAPCGGPRMRRRNENAPRARVERLRRVRASIGVFADEAHEQISRTSGARVYARALRPLALTGARD